MESWQHYLKENSSIAYRLPDFEAEWSEAKRYPALATAGKENWLKKAMTGEKRKITQKMLPKIGNTTASSFEDAKDNFSNLEKSKRARFVAAFKDRKIEMPIVIKMDGKYDLLGGNTRYTGLMAQGILPVVWLIDLDSPSLNEFKNV